MRRFPLLFLLPFQLLAQGFEDVPDKTPQEIQKELQSAEKQFQEAQKMFSPWYTGPLITPSPSLVAPGHMMTQPYLFISGNYSRYNNHRHAQDIPTLTQLQGLCVFQTGITETVDFIVTPSAEGQWQSRHHGGGFADLPITLGFLINKQTVYTPQIKFNIQQTFPTGRYKNLASDGLALSGLGGGSYRTQFSLGFGKVLFWSYEHPMNLRGFIGYTLSTPVRVTGFNSYGGGYGTDGTVQPGKILTADLGIEYSIDQPWVLALDVVYTATNRTTFTGHPGTTAAGTPASVGSGYSDNLSLAPAIEYNWSENAGFIAGAWFSVYGRNSLAFAQGVLSFYWEFPVVGK